MFMVLHYPLSPYAKMPFQIEWFWIRSTRKKSKLNLRNRENLQLNGAAGVLLVAEDKK